ncbi:MAG: precorrin-6y C5,15-methyltransferase (decarboxylating) subunit CbiE [Alphaproteobacteria bacterium]|nr:precorrin-6y C5,15-methyltransferase (decarboxylating) subunit CbiE [Alphaproteobacteria bacterium]
MTAPWITVVGLGEDGLNGLAARARAAVDAAEVLVGGERHLALVPAAGAERLTWRTPLKDTMADIAARRGKRVVVLASGDPMWFGVGVTLAKHFSTDEMAVLPVPGAFSLAAARLGWSLADASTITLHGRRVEHLHAHLAPGWRVLILSEDGDTPGQVASLLAARGYGDSAMTVLEHLGGPTERRIDATAKTWGAARAADLNTIAVTCVADADAVATPRAAGLADDLFQHDGQLTKREVRAATIAQLMPQPGQVLWDVGAGCGSIGIEWMRAAPNTMSFAVERDAGRCAFIERNAAFLGVPRLRVVQGAAPAALEDLPRPDAVFIGGGIGEAGLAEECWSRLPSGGRLVANAVTVEGEATLARLHGQHGGMLTRIAISRAEPVGGLLGWRPLMPVTQFATTKGSS